jgi:Fic family protein
MDKSKTDIEPDIKVAVMDRGEATGLMEPLVLGEACPARRPLTDLTLELAQKSASFKSSLPASLVPSLATLVRSMNCYYSNLIEGHDTHPIDIERALKSDFSSDPRKRNLQLEAKAHIAVQTWIDTGAIWGSETSAGAIREIHRRFYDEVPDELKWVEDPETHEKFPVMPAEYRQRDVRVGRHIPVSPGAVPRFMQRFEAVYGGLGLTESILNAAAAHHRLAWIHPFLDGNGRVIRLMSHAMFLRVLDTGAVWSIARGLARNVEEYKARLANCDLPRRNSLDGRGSLSEEMLAEFTEFFLRVSLDQVNFMERLMQPDRLRARIQLWAEEEIRLGELPSKSGLVLDALLYKGELPRGEVASLLSLGDRQARRIVESLAKKEVVVSESSRAPIRLAFPAALADRWMPGLFPDRPSDAGR